MFQATRQWWNRGRGKATARLFLFEFVVVMVGVLAAQALQNWAAHRNAVAAMEEGRSRLMRQFSDSLAYAQAWQAGIPCLNARMNDIMRTAATGETSSRALERPSMPTFIQEDLDNQADLLLREQYGDVFADRIKSMGKDLQFANRSTESLVQSWGRLRLADPEMGPPAEADRSIVRAAAADINAELVGLGYALSHFTRVANTLGLKPYSDDQFRAARNCDEVWQQRSLAIAI